MQAVLSPSVVFENKKHAKYSIADSQKAFTREIKQASDIDANHLSLGHQLLLFAIGTKFMFEQFVVLFENSKYVFPTYLAAIDFCFKITTIFKLKYNAKCQNIWLFVQNFCFDTPTNKKCLKVETFVNDINHLID